jgi:hypothetical protein
MAGAGRWSTRCRRATPGIMHSSRLDRLCKHTQTPQSTTRLVLAVAGVNLCAIPSGCEVPRLILDRPRSNVLSQTCVIDEISNLESR